MKMTIQKKVTKTLKVSTGDTLILRNSHTPDIFLAYSGVNVLAVSMDTGMVAIKGDSLQEVLNYYKNKIVGIKDGPTKDRAGKVHFEVTQTVPKEVDIRVGSLITYQSEKRLVVSAGSLFHSVNPDNFVSQGNYATIAELVHQGIDIYGPVQDVQKVQL